MHFRDVSFLQSFSDLSPRPSSESTWFVLTFHITKIDVNWDTFTRTTSSWCLVARPAPPRRVWPAARPPARCRPIHEWPYPDGRRYRARFTTEISTVCLLPIHPEIVALASPASQPALSCMSVKLLLRVQAAGRFRKSFPVFRRENFERRRNWIDLVCSYWSRVEGRLAMPRAGQAGRRSQGVILFKSVPCRHEIKCGRRITGRYKTYDRLFVRVYKVNINFLSSAPD